jgi:Ni/Co efflux regulator RcnB
MTKLLISTAIAGLLALSGTAFAQGDDHNRGGHAAAEPHGQGAPQGARAAGPGNRGHEDRQPSAGRQAAPAAAAPAAPTAMRGPAPNNAMRGPDNRRAPDNAMRGAAPNNNAMRGPAPNNAMRGPDNRAGGPGNRGGHQDFSSYRRNFSAPQHYHAPSNYRRPNGWYARRWTFGEFLPSLFWAQDYWLNDYNEFGLMPPPPGTVWVRDGDDALLIDRDSGEIIQVEYNVFY